MHRPARTFVLPVLLSRMVTPYATIHKIAAEHQHRRSYTGYECHRGAEFKAAPGRAYAWPFPRWRRSHEAAISGVEQRRSGMETSPRASESRPKRNSPSSSANGSSINDEPASRTEFPGSPALPASQPPMTVGQGQPGPQLYIEGKPDSPSPHMWSGRIGKGARPLSGPEERCGHMSGLLCGQNRWP